MNTATREFKKHNTHLSKPESVNMLGSSVSPLQGQAIAIQTSAPLRMQDRSTGAHSTHAHEEQHHSHDHFGHHHNGDHHDHLHSHGTDQGYNNGHSHSHHHHEHQAHGHDHDHDHDHAHSHYQESHYHAHASSNDHSHHYDQNHLHNHARTVQSPLPSMSSIFSNLSAEQKTIFTVACIQATVGFFIYWTGGSLAMIAFSYLVVFDAIGLINTFLSTVLELEPSFRSRNLKRPFGAVRLQVLFALATAIYLLFFSMQVGKESLEHLLLPSSHDTTENAHTSHSDKTPGLFAFLLSSAAIALSFLSGVNLQNHETFCKVWRRMPITMQGISYSVINRGRQGIINTLRGNIFASTVVGCGCLVVVSSFIFASPALDKLIATFEAAIMFYLAAPTAMALSKLVLQTTPKGLGNGIEGKLRELQQIKGVLSIGRTHFWQNTFGQHVASLEIHVAPDIDEQEVLQSAYQALRGLIKVRGIEQDHSTLDAGELTISIIKA